MSHHINRGILLGLSALLTIIPIISVSAQCSSSCSTDNASVGETSCVDIGIPNTKTEAGIDAINTSTDSNIINNLNGDELVNKLDNCCGTDDKCVSIKFTVPASGGCFSLEEINAIGSGSVFIDCTDLSNKFDLALNYPAGQYDMIFCPPGGSGSKRIGFAPLFIIDALGAAESCTGQNDGSITVNYSLGNPNVVPSTTMMYSIDGVNGSTVNTTGVFNGLGAGTYTVHLYEQGDPSCYSTTDVVIPSGGACCDLNDPSLDCDGDGVLNGVDCGPNDASITSSPGNLCDAGSGSGSGIYNNSCICVDQCNAINSGNTDTDSDGLSDICDSDDDGDWIPDVEEMYCDNIRDANIGNGSGNNQDQIYIFNWDGTAFADGLQSGDSQTFSLGGGLSITAVFSEITTTNNSFYATDMATDISATADNLYQTAGTKEAFYNSNAGDEISGKLTLTATKNGLDFPLTIIVIDAESTGNSEAITFSTDGNPWTAVDNYLSGAIYSLTASDQTVSITNTIDKNTVFSSEFATTINFSTITNGSGAQAMAFGVRLICDSDDDGIPNYLDGDSDNDGCPDAYFNLQSGAPAGDLGEDWGIAWGDYNNDGYVDAFVISGDLVSPNRLYTNNGDGSFTLYNSSPITTDVAKSTSATWGDYDNDGDLDIFVANNSGYYNFLYRNDGNGSFTKVSGDPTISYDSYAHGASWGDYNGDGFLDLFVAEYHSTQLNRLFLNNGDGTFTRDETAAPALESSSSVSGIWTDYNNDRLLDLFVANSNGDNNSLYKNIGNGNFERITSGAIVNDGGNSVGASWGDYNNDGYMDLFVANASNQDNFLYTNNGNGTFSKVTSGAIVNDGGHSHGSSWADFDSDGDLDLFVANDQGQNDFIYQNNGNGTFTTYAGAILNTGGYSFGAAWADINNDLDPELYVANRQSTDSDVYLNSIGDCSNGIGFILEGTISNSTAIGAKISIRATIDGQVVWQTREISGQTGGGTSGQNDLRALFGLGDAVIVDSVIVEWPSGYTQYLTNQPVNTYITIVEDAGAEVCGVAYYDINGNCVQDADEPGISNINIVLQPGNHVVTTNDTGAYSIYLQPDNYTVSPQANTLWDQSCTFSYTVNAASIGQSYCGNDFAYTPIVLEADLSVEITNTPLRIGEENLVALSYANEGIDTSTSTVLSFTHDANLTLVGSSIDWNSYDGTTATWSLGELQMDEGGVVYLTAYVDPTTTVGSTINMDAAISSDQSESITANNSHSTSDEALGSFDPNDIAVQPAGVIEPDQELVYKIRFQNVGNAPARTVRVVDELPYSLDLTTFEMGLASHPYRFEIQDDRTLVWTFDNINLPDSISNEVESHGYVIFKIKPQTNLEAGEKIFNKAMIYFDFNAFIETNVVVNSIQEEKTQQHFEIQQLYIFPNPVNKFTRIQLPGHVSRDNYIREVAIFNAIGEQVFYGIHLETNEFLFDRDDLPYGAYFVRVVDDHNQIYTGRIVLLHDD